ncbi:MAG: 1-acyl-sn-glycerol-3-phosphate acyltransferase [Ilumatobacteraceae bacterium]
MVCRHVSLFDASLPAVLYQRLGFHTRGVVMAELLSDPGFDLLYQRAGSVFVARDHDPAAASLAARVAARLGPRTVGVVFPEGRLARPELIGPALERLGARDPDRAARLASLRHLLPPRPGGVSALLDAAPDADVVVVHHVGFDHHRRFVDLVDAAPLDRPIRVDVRRIARSEVPDGPERTRWFDDLWLELDRWVAVQLDGGSGRESNGVAS